MMKKKMTVRKGIWIFERPCGGSADKAQKEELNLPLMINESPPGQVVDK